MNSGQKSSVQCSISSWTGLFFRFFFSRCDKVDFELAVVLLDVAVVLCELADVLCDLAVESCVLALDLFEQAETNDIFISSLSGIRYEKAYYFIWSISYRLYVKPYHVTKHIAYMV